MLVDTTKKAPQGLYDRLLRDFCYINDLDVQDDPDPLTYGIIGEVMEGTDNLRRGVHQLDEICDAIIRDVQVFRYWLHANWPDADIPLAVQLSFDGTLEPTQEGGE